MSGPINYTRNPRSPSKEGTRVDRIFSIISESGQQGICISEIIERVKANEPNQQGVDQDVRTKVSTWLSLTKNPTQKEGYDPSKRFMLVVDQKGKKGRPPEGQIFDRRVAIVFDGEPLPPWAISIAEAQPD